MVVHAAHGHRIFTIPIEAGGSSGGVSLDHDIEACSPSILGLQITHPGNPRVPLDSTQDRRGGWGGAESQVIGA